MTSRCARATGSGRAGAGRRQLAEDSTRKGKREKDWMGHYFNNAIAQPGKAEYKKGLAPKGARTGGETPAGQRRPQMVAHDGRGALPGIRA